MILTHVVQFVTDQGVQTPSEWRARKRAAAVPGGFMPAHGTPNAKNLAAYVAKFEASTAPGGVNAHLGVTKVLSAKIVRQADHEILATYAG